MPQPLALLGPVALRVKTVPVVPALVACGTGAMMRRRSSSSNTSVEARDSASVEVWDSGADVGRRSSTTVSLGSPPARMVSMLPGAQASLFSSMA